MSRFNIRVYGIWITDNHVLMCSEQVRGNDILKFPGGGLEFGEGIVDCLKREWIEELNCDIQVLGHFYTTDFFQASAFDDSQVVSIYYNVMPTGTLNLPVSTDREYFHLRKIDASLLHDISLPIDIVVGKMLFDKFA